MFFVLQIAFAHTKLCESLTAETAITFRTKEHFTPVTEIPDTYVKVLKDVAQLIREHYPFIAKAYSFSPSNSNTLLLFMKANSKKAVKLPHGVISLHFCYLHYF